MKVYIGADHNGYELKEQIETYLKQLGHDVVDEGGQTPQPGDDFPIFAAKVVTAMLGSDDTEPRGILICGSGQGMVMAANRFKGIRASLVWNESEARASRNDDDSNVLCLPSLELKGRHQVQDIVDIWLKTPFARSARFVRRVKQLDELN
ncbi:RpiB/LacA/LacB family sugar-phosphate isomerase [Candidatus Saccharibacteria bacterium]|nr:RpiB/LacA/LacB family sugar-phosphate isomerase [Candidatus Saccharibacteria bacterium]